MHKRRPAATPFGEAPGPQPDAHKRRRVDSPPLEQGGMHWTRVLSREQSLTDGDLQGPVSSAGARPRLVRWCYSWGRFEVQEEYSLHPSLSL